MIMIIRQSGEMNAQPPTKKGNGHLTRFNARRSVKGTLSRQPVEVDNPRSRWYPPQPTTISQSNCPSSET